MKKILLFVVIFLCCEGCGKNVAIISHKDSLTFEYGTDIYYSDLINIKDGKIDNDSVINYDKVGQLEISIPYKDIKNHKGKYNVIINIVDTSKPILSIGSNYYVEKHGHIDLCAKAFFADNATRNLDCKVFKDVNTSAVGTYKHSITITDEAGNKSSKDVQIHVVDKINKVNQNEIVPDYINEVISTFKNEKNSIGIDVSSHQGDIDWIDVKNSGIEFAMLRIGYGHNNDRKINIDDKFWQNYNKAKEVGIKIGAYFYSAATELWEAEEQANWIINTLNGIELDLPIAFDFELWNNFKNFNINIYDINKVAKKFLNILNDNGYQGLNYGSKYYLNNIWQVDNYPIWLAHYSYETNFEKPYLMWQFTNTGIVNGINGYVDINIMTKKI